jgi:hypothetical protein
LEALYFLGNQKAMTATGMTTISMSAMAAMITNRSESPMGPLGSKRIIWLQPPSKTAAHSDGNPIKTQYLLLFIYPSQ